jgi:flagellar hook-length control protein FliK
MTTPVHSASSTATNPDISRQAGNGLLNLSFSDLLRGQMQSGVGVGTGTPELSSPPNPNPSRTPSPEPSRSPGDSSSASPNPNPVPSRQSQEPTRTNSQNNPPEAGQKRPDKSQDTPPPQHAETNEPKPIETSESAETGKSAETGGKGKTAGDGTAEHSPQSQHPLAEAAISPGHPVTPDLLEMLDPSVTTDLPATIAALLGGLAGKVAENIPENELAPETSVRGAVSQGTGLPRHPEAPGHLSAHATASTAVQAESGSGSENSNAECGGNDNQGTNPNLLSTLASRPPRQTASIDSTAVQSGTGNESSGRVNAAAAFGTMVNAANALAAVPHEGSGARTVSAGMPATTGEVSMLNPPRLSTQAGATLPQFTIPAGAGQKSWAEEIGNRVMWMLGRAQSRAELILTPPLLGKVEVSIHLNGDQSTAQFLASSQSAREALEQAMPRLRELLAQAGINLGEASVNTSAEDRAPGGENTQHAKSHTGDVHDTSDDGGDASVIPVQNWSRLDTGIINTYA